MSSERPARQARRSPIRTHRLREGTFMSKLEIEAKLVNGAAVIYPGPYLNQLRGEEIERRCRELLAQGMRDIAINLDRTELVNSIGISLLIGVIEAVSEAGGTLVLSDL